MAEVVASTGRVEIAVCDCGARFVIATESYLLFQHEDAHARKHAIPHGQATTVGWMGAPAILPRLAEPMMLRRRNAALS